MQRTQITLADGRYLIFYTFDERAAPPPVAPAQTDDQQRAPQPAPDAEEERRV
jgi:hypothetical protein